MNDLSPAECVALLPDDLRQQFYDSLSDEEIKLLAYDWANFWARKKQLPPPGNWRIWLILAGRGFGKTRTITQFGIEQAQAFPGSRGAIVGATAADVRDVLIEGESGVLAVSSPYFKPVYEPSKRRITFPNGSTATTFSADEPDRLRGPQHHWAICDELAAWRRPEAFDMLLMGLRLGDNPRCAIATTPRPTAIIKGLLSDRTAVVTRGSTYENRNNLAVSFFDQVISRYQGTRLGQQEIEAVVLMDTPGALWKDENIEALRVLKSPELKRIVVAIDPAVTNNENSDETGIVVAGLGSDGHGYILDDLTLKSTPSGWARQAIVGYHKYKADRIVAEANNGGDMIETVIKTEDKTIAFTKVHASRGKHTRAEPVSALYEQGKVHHVGVFGALESQMTTWVPGEDSPDRMDALVWALTDLMLGTPSNTPQRVSQRGLYTSASYPKRG